MLELRSTGTRRSQELRVVSLGFFQRFIDPSKGPSKTAIAITLAIFPTDHPYRLLRANYKKVGVLPIRIVKSNVVYIYIYIYIYMLLYW